MFRLGPIRVPLRPEEIAQAEETVKWLEEKYGMQTRDFLEGLFGMFGTVKKILLPGHEKYVVPDAVKALAKVKEWDRDAWCNALDILKVAGKKLTPRIFLP